MAALTLKRLLVWTLDPRQRMTWLALLADHVKGLKGGALLSAAGHFARHGDPALATTLAGVLAAAAQPWHAVLHAWVTAGELNDPYGEFFVAADESVDPDHVRGGR